MKETIPLDEANPELLKNEIRKSGNVDSYKKLTMYYVDKKMDPDFLEISILMYEKYKCIDALSIIYDAVIYKYNPEIPFYTGDKTALLSKVPINQKLIALHYLKIGLKIGDYSCIENLSEYYLSIGDYEKSRQLMKKIDSIVNIRRKYIKDSLNE